ncbi:MAG: hypothetical protein ACFBSG_03600 [Leptolyngbyaceae cyanobacterium]
MSSPKQQSQEIQRLTGLTPTHFADLIRVAQLIDHLGGGVSGRMVAVDWMNFGIPPTVASNLQLLGQQYRYELPHADIEVIWHELTPEARSWLIAHHRHLWEIEEAFPPLDED